MPEPLAYLNGRTLPETEAVLPVADLGLQGIAVTEMTRTFRGTPFRLDDHLDRLFRSLTYVGLEIDESRARLRDLSEEIVAANRQLLPPDHELGLVQFVTAGQNLTYLGPARRAECRRPTVCIHTFPLAGGLWASLYETGQPLVVPTTRHLPPECLEPKVKSRSRLHWYLADQQAQLADLAARALLLDLNGNLTETAAGNFFIVRGGIILTPTTRNILAGVSRQVVIELADRLGIPIQARDLQLYDALIADEAFTSSTPPCLLPVTRLNGRPVGNGRPGPIYQALLQAWSQLVGVDIAGQMRSLAAE